MTVTEPRTDQKAGYCGRCRAGDHALCASPVGRCTCTERRHPNRPRPQEATVPAAARQIAAVPDRRPSSTTAKKEPLWELVKEDPPTPPAKARKLTPAERVEPMLAAIVEAGEAHEWHRVAVFGTPHAAGRAKALLAKDCPEWEWTSTRDRANRPAVFTRLIDASPTPKTGA